MRSNSSLLPSGRGRPRRKSVLMEPFFLFSAKTLEREREASKTKREWNASVAGTGKVVFGLDATSTATASLGGWDDDERLQRRLGGDGERGWDSRRRWRRQTLGGLKETATALAKVTRLDYWRRLQRREVLGGDTRGKEDTATLCIAAVSPNRFPSDHLGVDNPQGVQIRETLKKLISVECYLAFGHLSLPRFDQALQRTAGGIFQKQIVHRFAVIFKADIRAVTVNEVRVSSQGI
nr:hypothetical protein Iba_chr13fCG4080 [Ipomoea batatas]